MKIKRSTLARVTRDLHTLRRLVLDAERLHAKDLMRRYGWSKATLYRMIHRGKLPHPVRWTGPLWKLRDLEAAERAGQLGRYPRNAAFPLSR